MILFALKISMGEFELLKLMCLSNIYLSDAVPEFQPVKEAKYLL